jgi:hypothetical protein
MTTSVNIKIFQIYFKPELIAHCDPHFVPLDNTANPRPDLREWDVWNREHEARMASDLDYWGYVSWKFKEKTNLTGEEVISFILSNPGQDAYLLNPCIINEACFANSWEQGDIHHPNISDIGNSFFKKVGYGDIDVKSILLDRNATVFANYIVGSRKFWTKFMEFSRKLFTEAEKDLEFKHQVFGEGLSNYAHDKSLPNFTFLIERLIPTFLELERLSAIGYKHTQDTLPMKYQPYADDIMALSDLKVAVNRYNSDELYDVWNFYRHKFLMQNQGILNLE